MSSDGAQLSNPFSTGGGGANFENQVQTAFLVLMLTGGVLPCPHAWPITEVKLQGKYAGFNTDDLIVFVEHPATGQKGKLLAQIKHSLSISEGDEVFGEVIQAMWKDFQDPNVFDPKTDALALITGPLSALDIANARTLLEWARHSAPHQDFLHKVQLGKFSSDAKRTRLAAFRSQLKKANDGNDLSDEQFWKFLRSFHLLGFDLDIKSGVTLSLLNSHIGQFHTQDIPGLWAKMSREVESFNQNAGTITRETLPAEIRDVFAQRVSVATIPPELLMDDAEPKTHQKPDVGSGDKAEALALAALIGSWNEKVEGDILAVRKVIEGK